MGRKCRTCAHPRRGEIEKDLLDSVTYRNIGTKYGISYVSVRRHFENGHIARDLVKATELRRIAYSEDLLDKLLFLQHEALKILVEAKNPVEGKPLLNTALSAIELYAEAFEVANALDKLEAFASFNGADFYGLPRNTARVTLTKTDWTLPEAVPFGEAAQLKPLRGGEVMHWKLA